jgi:hypothetical protein
MSYVELIEEAESFAAGCSRTRLELRLVDALKEALARNENDARDLRKLMELESGGVDNWVGYDEVDWGYVDTGERTEGEW